MPKHIGIVACSAEGAALCYRTICAEGAELMGPHMHPEITMHTIALGHYMHGIRTHDWREVGELMLISARILAQAGADFLICPDNTIHQSLPFIEPISPLPWLHIARNVAAEARARGFKRIAITGTQWLTDGPVYSEAFTAAGLEFMRPEQKERVEINRIIFDELVYGNFKPESLAYFQQVIGRLRGEGCDAVVLGCTEIPLLVNDGNSPLPTLDSTRLLARAALRSAVA